MNTTFLLLTGVVIFFCLLTVGAFIDIAFKDFGTPERKAIWVLVNAVPFIGCVIYFIFGFRKGKRMDAGNM